MDSRRVSCRDVDFRRTSVGRSDSLLSSKSSSNSRPNQLMLWDLAFTVLAGIFVLVATRMVVFRSGQMSTTQELLSAAKDRQLEADLRGKDVEIAGAKRDAADASIRPKALDLRSQEQMNRLNARGRKWPAQ